jgi:hypothetical protein
MLTKEEWQWDVALPSCGQACAQSRPGGVGAAKDLSLEVMTLTD